MATGIVANAATNGFRDFAQIFDQCIHLESGEVRMIFQKIIGIGDVGLVVFRVMDLHRLRIDVRHEGVIGIR